VFGEAFLALEVHSAKEDVDEGEKNQSAAGRYFCMIGIESESEAPQLMKPMPMGNVPLDTAKFEDWKSDCALSR
jgi:hypothetical protein